MASNAATQPNRGLHSASNRVTYLMPLIFPGGSHLKWRRQWLRIATAAAVCCAAGTLPAQGPPASPVQSAASAADASDPTRAEIQPRLDIDRDPIPSPDVGVTLPESSLSSITKSVPGGVEKGHDGMYTLRTNVDEVLLNCTVIDDKGRIVTDLKPGDFRVWEDGTAQTINSAMRQDVPISMGILVDNSGSMRDKRASVNVAALTLLKDSNRQDTAFIVNFSDRAFLDQGFTSDLVALNRGLTRFDSHGTTAMYDAVAASADELVKHAKERKQALLIITDGADNASRLTLAQAIRRVQNLGGPVVYTIGLLFDTDPQETERARDDLSALAQETGGVAYFPRSLDELDKIAGQVASDIRNQYTVDYRSTKSANLGGYRTVHVEASVPGHGKLTVRTKKGYYAQPLPRNEVSETKQN
jgi:Ca-activated chloride channel homolog